MKTYLIAALFVGIVAYVILSRWPQPLRRVFWQALAERVEPQRAAVARRPLTWFVVLGAMPSFALGLLGRAVEFDFFPHGMAALAALAVAWACDRRPRDAARPLLRAAVAVGGALAYLLLDLAAGEFEALRTGRDLVWFLRLDLVTAAVIGWVLSGAVSPTMAIRRLIRRLWTSGERWTYSFVLLAWPLATAAVLFVFKAAGIAELTSTRTPDAMAYGPFLAADLQGLYSTGALGSQGIWGLDDPSVWLHMLDAMMVTALYVTPFVVAWYGFAAPRLMWRMSPLAAGVTISLLAAIGELWVLVPIPEGATYAWWSVGSSFLGVTFATLAAAFLVAAAAPTTVVWLLGRRADALLPVVILVGVTPIVTQKVVYTWVDWERPWANPLATALAQVGVAAALVFADRMWQRPAPSELSSSTPAPPEALPDTDGAAAPVPPPLPE